MYVVIFRASIRQFDQDYQTIAEELRDLALSHYNCIEFVALTEGNNEIALSYWHSEEDILKWKQNAQHLVAQSLGMKKWYQSYSVEITKVTRRYDYEQAEEK